MLIYDVIECNVIAKENLKKNPHNEGGCGEEITLIM